MAEKFKTWYFDDAVFNLPGVIEEAKEILADVDFDTLVGTGFSGGIVIPALALAMGKKFVLVRKESDDSHHGRGRLLGELGKRWIFVDDFVSSGRTRTRVMEKIQEAATGLGPARTVMVGQYMYAERGEGSGFDYFEPFWVPEGSKVKQVGRCTCSLCSPMQERFA